MLSEVWNASIRLQLLSIRYEGKKKKVPDQEEQEHFQDHHPKQFEMH